jgi:vancomycin resistance protein YoaR
MTMRENAVRMPPSRALLRLVLSLVVLAGVYVGVATFLSGHVPSDARVDGIAIGGMSPHAATVTLNRQLAARASRPVQLRTPSRTISIQPRAAGLEIDLPATLADLSGFSLNPVHLWKRLTGTTNEPLQVRVDRDKLTAVVTTAARTVDSRVREGSITFTGDGAAAVASVAGNRLVVPATADAVVAAWPNRQVVQAVIDVTRPKVSAAEIRRATRELAVPAMSEPVTLPVGSPVAATIILRPGEFAPALSLRPDKAGRLQLTVRRSALMTAIRSAAPDVELPAVDATVRLVAGRPQVVPGVIGTRFDEHDISARFRVALTSLPRTVTTMLVPLPPAVTTATAQGWRIKSAISTFTTQFPVNPPRTNNIKVAVQTLNGTLVRPGAQFSLNAALGERTPAKGYQKAPVIYAGRLITDYGGGVSQVSTTTFNAAFFAGVRIDQHTPHSFYIARYPEGREVTVSWPNVDQKWTNDTGSGILVQSSVKGDNLTVTLWGTKAWDIEAVKGPRRNVVKPRTIIDAHPGCVPQVPTPGFDVTVTQIFKRNAAAVRTVRFDTHYIPEDYVKCTRPVVP